MSTDSQLQQPLVLSTTPGSPSGKPGGTTHVGESSWKSMLGLSLLVVAEVLLCGSWSPVPQWLSIVIVVVAVVPTVTLLLQLVLVKLAVKAIMEWDQVYMGVDIDIGALHLNLFTGRLVVQDLTIHNPPGYSGPYLAKSETFVLDLDMWRILSSFGMIIEVTEVIGKNISASLEFDGYVYGKSNVTTVVNHIKAASKAKGDIQPVYSYWHAGNGEHTFHFEPAWGGEERLGCQFFAYEKQAEGTEPVYDFWHSCYREHTFRLGEHYHSALEWRGNCHFYAFREQAPNTEPVYDFWHVGNREHTYHFLPAWDREETGQIQFYAYRKDPLCKVKHIPFQASLKPVYDFWHSRQGQHQYHFLPPWGGEKKGVVQFYAFDRKVPNTAAVCDFYVKQKGKKTFHMGEARQGEERLSALFYAFTQPMTGAKPVYEFWHEENQEINLHTGDPWPGEVKREVAFYAYREDPAKTRKIFLKKVVLQKIKAKSATKIMGAAVKLDDMSYKDFSTEFEAETADVIVEHLLNELFAKVSVGIW